MKDAARDRIRNYEGEDQGVVLIVTVDVCGNTGIEVDSVGTGMRSVRGVRRMKEDEGEEGRGERGFVWDV